MPASEIARKFREGTLHSGSPHGPIVTNPKQALAIRLGYLRDEGKIPERKKGRMAEAFANARR
jgi:hypothetical protein